MLAKLLYIVSMYASSTSRMVIHHAFCAWANNYTDHEKCTIRSRHTRTRIPLSRHDPPAAIEAREQLVRHEGSGPGPEEGQKEGEKKGGKRGGGLPEGSRVARAPSCRGTAKAGAGAGPSGHACPERPQSPGPAGAAAPAPSKAQRPSPPPGPARPRLPPPGPHLFPLLSHPGPRCRPRPRAVPGPAAGPRPPLTAVSAMGPVAALRSPLPAARPARLYLIPAARAAPPQGPMGNARCPSAPPPARAEHRPPRPRHTDPPLGPQNRPRSRPCHGPPVPTAGAAPPPLERRFCCPVSQALFPSSPAPWRRPPASRPKMAPAWGEGWCVSCCF